MSSDRSVMQDREPRTEPFRYAQAGDESLQACTGENGALNWVLPGTAPKVNLEQQVREAFEGGLKEGEGRARASYDKQLVVVQSSVAGALETFCSQRETYFNRIEPEVVQLALAMARKILHREAQMDPLLLTGMVHVALEKLDAGTRVRLRAHPSDVHFWSEYFAQSGFHQPLPEVFGDPALQHGECALETEMGDTHISLDTQLKEIEQGFFDLLDQRPRAR
jgi:flagellar biosynthesis/type III secretory pathway protein FliH